jgi:hypothetical protein
MTMQRCVLMVVPLISGLSIAVASEPPASPSPTFAIETYVGRTYNYLDNLVDKDGLRAVCE